MSKKIITPEGTLSFPHLDVPVADTNEDGSPKGKPKYSLQIRWDKGTDLSAMQAAVIEAAVEKFGPKGATMVKTGQLKTPFRTDWEAKSMPEGTVYTNMRTEQQPGLALPWKDAATGKVAVLDPENHAEIKKIFYPGARVRVAATAYFYDVKTNKGITFGLNNIQKLGDGPRLDGRTAAQDEFEPTQELAPADLTDLE